MFKSSFIGKVLLTGYQYHNHEQQTKHTKRSMIIWHHRQSQKKGCFDKEISFVLVKDANI